jgi:CubicO group peptidase (beta-lactamase class C family)
MVLLQEDQLAYAESRPKAEEPGEQFNYSSGTSMLLSGVLEQATGMPADEYAKEKLFDPIGMTKVDWWRDAEGHTLTYCCVDTPSRDFARFGLLYLNGGRWGGDQIVPEDYVEASVTGAPASPDQYGLQWWLGDVEGVPEDLFSANGHDGQYIYVIPSLDLVVVRNSTYVKHDGPPIADPNLFTLYPSDGFIVGKGTLPPDEWDAGELLRPLVEDLAD